MLSVDFFFFNAFFRMMLTAILFFKKLKGTLVVLKQLVNNYLISTRFVGNVLIIYNLERCGFLATGDEGHFSSHETGKFEVLFK